jgi:hypothetical protein
MYDRARDLSTQGNGLPRTGGRCPRTAAHYADLPARRASASPGAPRALSQPDGYALGAQAGEAAIRQVATDAGFTRFRRAAETPFNIVYEVRP